jgi:hypothetical protein
LVGVFKPLAEGFEVLEGLRFMQLAGDVLAVEVRSTSQAEKLLRLFFCVYGVDG